MAEGEEQDLSYILYSWTICALILTLSGMVEITVLCDSNINKEKYSSDERNVFIVYCHFYYSRPSLLVKTNVSALEQKDQNVRWSHPETAS